MGLLPAADAQTRREAGRAERQVVARSEHAVWAPPAERPDPVDVLERQAAQRVPEFVPIRYGRMAVSPFSFYRGGAAIMAWDLAHTPTTALRVQACGDAHLLNFGVFAAPDRQLVFDLNDFDETLPAPFEWDLKRLAASFVIAARDNAFTRADQRDLAQTAVHEYQRLLAAFVPMPFLDVWYERFDADSLQAQLAANADGKVVARFEKQLTKAQRRTSLGALARFAERSGDGYRIKPDPPLIVPVPPEALAELEPVIRQGFADYGASLSPERRMVLSRYHFVDFARKVVGVGSVGTEAYMLLLMGNGDGDPLFLQLKQAQESVLAPYAGASTYEQQGERVVHGQRIMQAASDTFLGWFVGTGAAGRHFYLRQLRDMKGSADVSAMTPHGMKLYARACGATLARAHARSGDVAQLSGYVGTSTKFADAVTEFAVAYADQNERDYEALLAAEADGRVTIERGV